MTMWDMPIEKLAITEAGLPESDAEWRTWEEAQRALRKHEGEDERGMSEYDPSVWMMGKHAPKHEKYQDQRGYGGDSDFLGDDEDYEDDFEEPEEYHIVTRPRDTMYAGPGTLDEHPYHAFGNAYTGTADSAMDMFAEDHPEYDTERYPDAATHEIVSAHPAEDHDRWHKDLRDEDETFNSRIHPAGLQRESPEVPGHRAYRYEEPNGVVHRLWRSPYHSDGPAWQTSRYDPSLPREQQPTMWTSHSHSTFEDPLGEALEQVRRNREIAR